MIIKSYLAYPQPGKRLQLEQALSAMSGCDVIPAANRDLLILVTESEDKQVEDDLIERLESLATLQTLTLVSGFNEAAAQAQTQ